MSINRMSFNETTNILNNIGFQVRLKIDHDSVNNIIYIRKGGMVFGFKENNETYGWIIDNDEQLEVPNAVKNRYILLSKEGNFSVVAGDFNNIRGIGANINGVPWYTYNGNAIIGKIFGSATLITGIAICDDAYWCEYEGENI